MEEVEYVSIALKEYLELLDRSEKLRCLEDGGVDNWTWYEEAMKPYWEKLDK